MPVIKPSRHFEGSDLGLDDPVLLGGTDVSDLLAEIVGPITWVSNTEGFCQCPGSHLHTTKDSRKDCKLFLQPVPTLSCFHSSCRVLLQGTIRNLRTQLRNRTGVGGPTSTSPEQKALLAKVRQRESLRRQAATSRFRILRDYRWPYDQIIKDSVHKVPSNPRDHWRALLELFAPDDVVWIGDIYHSGKPEHADHFREREEWEALPDIPGQFTCPSVFVPGTFARKNDAIDRRAYLVVESDELDRDTIGAVFRWMRDKAGLKLRCIVDTAGKSLHGWFKFPTEDELEELRVVLPELGCDPKMFTASQPCRMPGAVRDQRYQRMIFLDLGGLA